MKLTRLVPVVAAAALFAGCSPMPGTAAQIGDTRITESQLDEVTAACESVGLTTEQVPRTSLLMAEILGAVAEEMAAANDIEITDEEAVDLLRSTSPDSPTLADPECARVASQSAKLQLIVTKSGEDADVNALQEQFEAVEVQLNPRYGTWDPAGSGISGTGSLSVPAS